jgi:hypothetical protein
MVHAENKPDRAATLRGIATWALTTDCGNLCFDLQLLFRGGSSAGLTDRRHLLRG